VVVGWYPGAEPGGGSYIAQRMLAAKTRRTRLAARCSSTSRTTRCVLAWIIVALASILVFPTLDDIRARFPYVDPSLIGHDMAYPAMLTFLPPDCSGS
jgi:hypothetical protein